MTQVPTHDIKTMNLAELREFSKQVEQAITERQMRQRGEAVAQVRQIAADSGLSLEELFALCVKQGRATGPAPIKYRDPATGEVWSGRGRQPGWVKQHLNAGKPIEALAVSS